MRGSQSSPFRQSLGESRFRWEHSPRDLTTHSTIHFELCCTKRYDLFQGDKDELNTRYAGPSTVRADKVEFALFLSGRVQALRALRVGWWHEDKFSRLFIFLMRFP